MSGDRNLGESPAWKVELRRRIAELNRRTGEACAGRFWDSAGSFIEEREALEEELREREETEAADNGEGAGDSDEQDVPDLSEHFGPKGAGEGRE